MYDLVFPLRRLKCGESVDLFVAWPSLAVFVLFCVCEIERMNFLSKDGVLKFAPAKSE